MQKNLNEFNLKIFIPIFQPPFMFHKWNGPKWDWLNNENWWHYIECNVDDRLWPRLVHCFLPEEHFKKYVQGIFYKIISPIAVTENNKKLIKSLIFIICFNLIGVCFKSSVQLLFKNIQMSVFIKNGFSTLFSFFTIAVYSANAPVLFIMRSEYSI